MFQREEEEEVDGNLSKLIVDVPFQKEDVDSSIHILSWWAAHGRFGSIFHWKLCFSLNTCKEGGGGQEGNTSGHEVLM